MKLFTRYIRTWQVESLPIRSSRFHYQAPQRKLQFACQPNMRFSSEECPFWICVWLRTTHSRGRRSGCFEAAFFHCRRRIRLSTDQKNNKRLTYWCLRSFKINSYITKKPQNDLIFRNLTRIIWILVLLYLATPTLSYELYHVTGASAVNQIRLFA